MIWTDENISELRRMFAANLSAGKIGVEMGVTRNSIIGKLHRLGLVRSEKAKAANRNAAAKKRRVPLSPTRLRKEREAEQVKEAAKTSPQLHGTKRRPLPQIALASAVAPPDPVRTGSGVSLLDLTPGACRWPLWADHNLPLALKFFCADPSPPGQSYCPACAVKSASPRATLPPALRKPVQFREAAE